MKQVQKALDLKVLPLLGTITMVQGRGRKGCQKSDNLIDTKKELSKVANVSHDTIAKVKKIEEKASPEQREKLVKGEATINQVFIQIKRQEVATEMGCAIGTVNRVLSQLLAANNWDSKQGIRDYFSGMRGAGGEGSPRPFIEIFRAEETDK